MNGFYKIGMTTNLQKRIESLKIIETDNSRMLEKELHEKFKNKRRNGEWFVLDDKDLQELFSCYKCKDGSTIVKLRTIPNNSLVMETKPTIIPKYKAPGILANIIFALLTAYIASELFENLYSKIIFAFAGLTISVFAIYILNLGYVHLKTSKIKAYACFTIYGIYILVFVVSTTIGIFAMINHYLAYGFIFFLIFLALRFIILKINKNFTFMKEYEVVFSDEHFEQAQEWKKND